MAERGYFLQTGVDQMYSTEENIERVTFLVQTVQYWYGDTLHHNGWIKSEK